MIVDSVVTPGYSVEFKDHRRFGKKQVAWRVTSEPEPGLNLQARITGLFPLLKPDESLFAVAEETPVADRVSVVHVSDETAKSLALEAPAIRWPTVRSGKTSGVLTLYMGVDRKGQVREVWPLNSDNPALDDAARTQVRTWKFKAADLQGVPAQFETILTIPFESSINSAVHVLTNEEARNLAEHVVEPRFVSGTAPKGTEITLRVSVASDGSIRSTSNPNHIDTALFLAGMNAVRQWKFRRYLRDGKPDAFEADITFRVQ
jgi:TonB family protein